MKTKAFRIFISITCLCMAAAYLIFFLFFDISHFTGHDLIKTVDSPDGKYEIVVYRNNGGATVDYALLCSVRSTANGKEKNIYWDYPYQEPVIQWENNNVVVINGHSLDVKKDTYDYRRQK